MVDWLLFYLVSKGATLCVQSVCILRKVGDATAQRRLFSASQPVSLPAFIALSLSFPLGSVLRSASLHTAWLSSVYPAS